MRYRTGSRAIDCRRPIFTGWIQTRVARVSESMGLSLYHGFHADTVSTAPAPISGAQKLRSDGSDLRVVSADVVAIETVITWVT